MLTLAKAKEDGLVDPKVLISANEYKKVGNSMVNKGASMSKVRLPGLVLCVLV